MPAPRYCKMVFETWGIKIKKTAKILFEKEGRPIRNIFYVFSFFPEKR
jgi:hypothetical protein